MITISKFSRKLRESAAAGQISLASPSARFDSARRERGRANFQVGFTLIELLIVVAVIGILSSLLMANFAGIRQRARDGQRKSNLKQIQAALELYRSDQGFYPETLPACNGQPLTDPEVHITYMKKIPCDPTNTDQYIFSYSRPTEQIYFLFACLENVNDSDKDATNNITYCDGAKNWSYTLENP